MPSSPSPPSSASGGSSPPRSTKRKRAAPAASELEIDVEAPEPPSKRTQRRAKRGKSAATTQLPEFDPDPEEPAAAAGGAPARSEWGIWAGNLPFGADAAGLRTFLCTHAGVAEGDMTRVHLPRGADGRNRGFAYVDFGSLAAQSAAVGASEAMMQGRRVLIKDAKSFAGRPEKKAEEVEGKPPSKRVFVGNLAFDADAAALRHLYGPCGEVADAFVATFEDSGKCKGYAWVTFEQGEGAAAAVRGWVMKDEDGKKRKWWVNQLGGRKIRAEFAEDAGTRYRKRFGRDKGEEKEGGEEEGTKAKEERPPRADRPKRDPRTVRPGAALAKAMSERQKTAAIVEAKGTKITFD